MTDKEIQLEKLITLLEKFDETAIHWGLIKTVGLKSNVEKTETAYLKAKMDLFQKIKEVVLS